MVRMKKRLVLTLLAVLALPAGWFVSSWFEKVRFETDQNKLHAEISSIRAHEEGYALRHGHYLLIPDSCTEPLAAQWQELGRQAPKKEIGCFRVESSDPVFATAATAPEMRIIGELTRLNLRGVEGSSDSKPAWSSLEPTK